MAERDVMGGAVIFHHYRVVDGKIVSTLLKIGHRIAASLHHFDDQLIGLGNRSLRIVDEPRLHVSPALVEFVV